MTAQVTAMELAVATAGEGQRFKRIPRQAWSGNLELDPLDTSITLEVCTTVDKTQTVTKRWIVTSPLEYTWENFQNDFKNNVMDIGDNQAIKVCFELEPKNNDDFFFPVISSQKVIHLNVKLDLKERNVEGLNERRKRRKLDEEDGLRPVGLLNYVNNCFANAVLQSLSCTTKLVSYLSQSNYSECHGFCFTCMMKRHIVKIQNLLVDETTFSPSDIVDNVTAFGGDFRKGVGYQYDAYEFLLKLIEAMTLKEDKHGSLDSLFGGMFTSHVTCSRCRNVSTTPNTFRALELEVHSDHKGNAKSLADCFNIFTEETLINGYKCVR